MPKFLTRDEIYTLLQREMPEDTYPHGEPSAFFSTADHDAIAETIAGFYESLENIYDNFFPQTATDRIDDWVFQAFGRPLIGSPSLEQKRDRVLAKIRSPKGLTRQDMVDIVQSVIGTDILVDVIEWNCTSGTWIIGESQLAIETYLGSYRMLDVVGEGLCSADHTDYGKTEDEWNGMKEQAYTFEILIYDYTLSADERDEIDYFLTGGKPTTRQHIITDGQDSNDILTGET